jgi:hypothetical protein
MLTVVDISEKGIFHPAVAIPQFQSNGVEDLEPAKPFPTIF